MQPARFIGIRHRVKQTAAGEARPTQVYITNADGSDAVSLELKTEDDELAFVDGQFVTKWRDLGEGEKVGALSAWQMRTAGTGEKKRTQVAVAVEGLQMFDRITMMMGGTGDDFAYALSSRAEQMSAQVIRVPAFVLKALRPSERTKDEDARTLSEIGRDHPERGYVCQRRDRLYIDVRGLCIQFLIAQRQRVAYEQQLRQRLTRDRFIKPRVGPLVPLAEAFEKLQETDVGFLTLMAKEKAISVELEDAVSNTIAWQKVFCSPQYKGCGVRISARLMAAIVDIRRFEVKPDPVVMQELKQGTAVIEQQFAAELAQVDMSNCPFTRTGQQRFWKLQKLRSQKLAAGCSEDAALLDRAIGFHKKRSQLRKAAMERGAAKLVKFCGTDVNDGKFVRRRVGQVSNYNPLARQALYLLADQWNKHPDTHWGAKLLENKARLRVKHPEVEVDERGKKRYTDIHILKMARWRTATQFVRALYYDWVRAEMNGA